MVAENSKPKRYANRAVIKRKFDEGEGIETTGPCKVRVIRSGSAATYIVDFDEGTEVRRIDACGDVEAVEVVK